MKQIIEFNVEEKERLRSFLDEDICKGINCTCFEECNRCPLKEAVDLKEKIDYIIERLLK